MFQQWLGKASRTPSLLWLEVVPQKKTQFQHVGHVFELLGDDSLELTLARDLAGNSPLMTAVRQEKMDVANCLWSHILKKSGFSAK